MSNDEQVSGIGDQVSGAETPAPETRPPKPDTLASILARWSVSANGIDALHRELRGLLREVEGRAETAEAALRGAATDLLSDLTLLRCDDELALWKLGGQPLHQDYLRLKAALADDPGPGPGLLAELAAARAFITAIRRVAIVGGWKDDDSRLLADYDEATRGATDG